MAIFKLPQARTNSDLFNRWATALTNAVRRALNIEVVAPLWVKSTPAGTILGVNLPERCFARLTSSAGGGAYAWSEVYATAAGGWVTMPGGRSGTITVNATWEYNLNALIPAGTSGPIVSMERNKNTGEWRFRYGPC